MEKIMAVLFSFPALFALYVCIPKTRRCTAWERKAGRILRQIKQAFIA